MGKEWMKRLQQLKKEALENRLQELSRGKKILVSWWRMGWMIIHGFRADMLNMRAASLTYITLISMVPCLAISFALAKGLGMNVLEETVQELHLRKSQSILSDVVVDPMVDDGSSGRVVDSTAAVLSVASGEDDRVVTEPVSRAIAMDGDGSEGESETKAASPIASQIADFMSELPPDINRFLLKVMNVVKNVNAGQLGAIGLLVTMLAVLKMMTNIEVSFNHIWGISAHRRFIEKCVFYSASCVFGSVLVLVSSAVTTTLASDGFSRSLENHLGEGLAGMVETLMSFSGVFSIVIAFMVIYAWMPNTRVNVKAAFVGGLVGGVAWKIMQVIYVQFQLGVTNANAIYGSFAAIPLFLVWLYSGWLIVLFGAEVAFAVQHWRTYDLEQEGLQQSFATKVNLAVALVLEVSRDFEEGKRHWHPELYAQEHMISHRLVTTVVEDLLEAEILCKLDNDGGYVPGRSIGNITLGDVEAAFRKQIIDLPALEQEPWLSKALSRYRSEVSTFDQSLRGVSLAELIKEN